MGKESAYTSLNQIPAGFKKFEIGRRNLDVGGGKFNTATKYLKKHGTINLVLDPYNRSKLHNERILEMLPFQFINTITCLNVLNVIQDKGERKETLQVIRDVVDEHLDYTDDCHPVVIFQFFEGTKSGKASKTTSQTNMKTVDYIPEIQEMFPEWEVQRWSNFLIV